MESGKSCILSPLYYLNNNLRSSLIYTENGNGITGIKITGMPLTGIYAAAAVSACRGGLPVV